MSMPVSAKSKASASHDSPVQAIEAAPIAEPTVAAVESRTLKANERLQDVAWTFPAVDGVFAGTPGTDRVSALAAFACDSSAVEGLSNGLNGIILIGGSKIKFDRDPDFRVNGQPLSVGQGPSPSATIACTATRKRENSFPKDYEPIGLIVGENRWETVKTTPKGGGHGAQESAPVFFYCRDKETNPPAAAGGIVLARGSRVAIARDLNYTFGTEHQPMANSLPYAVISCD